MRPLAETAPAPRSGPPRRPRATAAAALPAALLLAAAGVWVLWIAGGSAPGGPGRFPPGAVLLPAAAALTALVRRRWAVAVAVPVAALALLNALGGPWEAAPAAVARGAVVAGSAAALVACALLLRRRTAAEGAAEGAGEGRRGAWPQVAVLAVLAPVAAEYLAAYAETTGDALQLLGGLLVFVPLYGAPALLIREVARGTGRGWPAVLLLAAAFGVLQAGVVDQSLFSTGYQGIEGWEEGMRATLLAPLGISAANVVNFVGGHVVFSIAAPIAVAEALDPARARRRWLGRPGLALCATGWVLASALILGDSLTGAAPGVSPGQVAGALAVVVALVAAALALPRRTANGGAADGGAADGGPGRAPGRGDRVPRPAAVAAVAGVLALVHGFAPATWAGVALGLACFAAGGLALRAAARSRRWGPREAALVALPVLLVRAALAFLYYPVIGDVAALPKYGHNVAMLLIVLLLGAAVLRASRTGSGASRAAPPVPRSSPGPGAERGA